MSTTSALHATAVERLRHRPPSTASSPSGYLNRKLEREDGLIELVSAPRHRGPRAGFARDGRGRPPYAQLASP